MAVGRAVQPNKERGCPGCGYLLAIDLFVSIASSSDKSLRAAVCHSRVLRFDGAIQQF